MSKNVFDLSKDIRWCPGCGNYSILMNMKKTLSLLGISNENVVFISGIGCSGRFPYYINTNGFHTLHGRASAVATGLKMSRSDLIVWVVIGDGDGFSIGLSHILHMIRRNVNVNVLFINNKIYALTKGQYSPTSDRGSVTKSSPGGSIEDPINPLLLSLTLGATFVARVVDNDSDAFRLVVSDAIKHNGLSFIEVLQNCIVFNDGIYEDLRDKSKALKKVLYLENGKELFFGENKENAVIVDLAMKLGVIDNVKSNENMFIKHETGNENILQILLAKQSVYDLPYPLGIFRSFEKNTYEDCFKQNCNSNVYTNSFYDLFNRFKY